MKEGYRFVDCDMHIMEPPDLFDKYLDPEFKHRVTLSVRRSTGGPTGMRGRPLWYFDGAPTSHDGNVAQYNRIRGPLVSTALRRSDVAVERGDDAESQVMDRRWKESTPRSCSRPPVRRSGRATTWI